MSDLVVARLNGFDKPVGRAFAEAKGLEVLDESHLNPDGSIRRMAKSNGRPMKPKTSVAKKVAEKKAASPEPAKTAEEANE